MTVILRLLNVFKNTNNIIGFGVKQKVRITTKSTGISYLNDTNESRLKLILDLCNKGYSNKEISEFLNMNGIRPPRTSEFTTKLIWATLKKLQLREEKKTERRLESVDVQFYWIFKS